MIWIFVVGAGIFGLYLMHRSHKELDAYVAQGMQLAAPTPLEPAPPVDALPSADSLFVDEPDAPGSPGDARFDAAAKKAAREVPVGIGAQATAAVAAAEVAPPSAVLSAEDALRLLDERAQKAKEDPAGAQAALLDDQP